MKHLLPPILFVLLLGYLATLYQYHPDIGAMRPERVLPWDIVLPFGILLLMGAWIQFRRHDSEIVTFNTPRNLVTNGFYRISRNPMYLGFTLLLLAAAFFVNTWCSLLAPALFFAAANWWYIPFEERAAAQAFGTRYDEYRRKVRRWL